MKRISAIIAVILGALSGTASATTILFNDFSNVSTLQLNGNAAQAGTALRLTPATLGQSGTAFYSSAISLASNVSFSSAFSFRISNSGGIGDGDGVGADGITFIVQTNSSTAGGAGGGIGYHGVPNSVAIEYDTFDNGPSLNDPDGNHVGIDLGGNIASTASASVATRMNDGNIWYSWVDYNGVTMLLEVRLSQTSIRPSTAILSQTVNLATELQTTNAFVGFGSGTGSGVGDHDILSWEFRDTFAPINGSVPEPYTLALFALGLLGLPWLRRRSVR